MRIAALLASVPIAAILLLAGAPVGADDSTDAWKPDEVARVADRSVTWTDLCLAAADDALPRLEDDGLERWCLAALVSGRVLASLCTEHGVAIPEADVDALLVENEEQERQRRAGGLVPLDPERPESARRTSIRRVLEAAALGERGVDARAAVGQAEVRVAGTPGPDGAPVALPDDVFATVNGAPIRCADLGALLLAYAGERRVRELLDRTARIALADATGARLDPAAMDVELARHAELAPSEAIFDAEQVWEQMRVRGGMEKKPRHSAATLRRSPYAQALFGLVKRFREEATAAEVRAVWHRESETTFGPHVLVTAIEIPFKSGGDVFVRGPSRSRAEALRMARQIRADSTRGVPFDETAKRVVEAGEDGVRVARQRLYNTGKGHILRDAALALEDGATSEPIETLSEVHVLRREREVPAPSFASIEKVVRERLARQRTRHWLDESASDPDIVRIRWPLPALR